MINSGSPTVYFKPGTHAVLIPIHRLALTFQHPDPRIPSEQKRRIPQKNFRPSGVFRMPEVYVRGRRFPSQHVLPSRQFVRHRGYQESNDYNLGRLGVFGTSFQIPSPSLGRCCWRNFLVGKKYSHLLMSFQCGILRFHSKASSMANKRLASPSTSTGIRIKPVRKTGVNVIDSAR